MRKSQFSLLEEVSKGNALRERESVPESGDAWRSVERHERGRPLAALRRSFSLTPRGKNLIKVCLGTACHVKSGENLFEKALRDLNLTEEGTTTKDLKFTVEKVRCLGCCSLAPVVSVNEDTYGAMTKEMLSKVIKKYQGKKI